MRKLVEDSYAMVDCNYPGVDRGLSNPVLVWDSGQGAATKSMRCDSHE